MELTYQQLHNLAMNTVGRALQDLGWEFLLVNSDLKKNPQFVCLDPQGGKHFIIVRAVLNGDEPDDYDAQYMQKVKTHAKQNHAKAHWAGVGLTHLQNPHQPLILGEPYQVNFKGLLEIK